MNLLLCVILPKRCCWYYLFDPSPLPFFKVDGDSFFVNNYWQRQPTTTRINVFCGDCISVTWQTTHRKQELHGFFKESMTWNWHYGNEDFLNKVSCTQERNSRSRPPLSGHGALFCDSRSRYFFSLSTTIRHSFKRPTLPASLGKSICRVRVKWNRVPYAV